MLGHGHPGVLLDPAFPWWVCLQSGFLSCRHRLFGDRRWWWHDPYMEYILHKEQLWCENFLAGCQVQGYSGKEAFSELATNFFQITNSLLENTYSYKWTLLGIQTSSRVFSMQFESGTAEGLSLTKPITYLLIQKFGFVCKIKVLFKSHYFLIVRN